MKKFCALVLIYLCTFPCISYPESTNDLVSDIKNKEDRYYFKFQWIRVVHLWCKKQDGEVESNAHGIIIEVIELPKQKKYV